RALERARTKALATARDLFERRACNSCHEVEVAGAGEAASWRVGPVQLTREWMPKAHFSHARHSTTLTACTTCHAADRSARATDVLMPGIQACRDCHGGATRLAGSQALVPSDCTLCHSFHVPGNELWAGEGRTPGSGTSP
ncbi:MAG TPA: cytochrome c3 family protein, partial [Steroidobacteraceae bacterium]|nr:cytochrome c3 family protein [Steroidobacteraceae bacterium]